MRDTGLFSPMANLQRSSPTSPDEVKQGIMQSLKMAANSLSHNHVALGHTITSSDTHANALCNAVEAVFVHGLRPQYIRRVQATRRHRRKKGHTLPRPVFWQVIRAVTHRDVLAQLGGLRCITTDVGRCRAWLRVALNDGLLECYLASLLVDPISLAEFYWSSGLLLDPECSAQLQTLVQGLSGLPFHLSANASMLNEWTTTPLSLAGLCIVQHSGAVSLEAAPRRAVSCSNVTSLTDSFRGYDVSGVPPAGPSRSYSLYEGLAANIENDGGILDKTAGLVYESSSFCGSQGDGSYGSELSSNTDGLSLPEDLIMDLVSPAQSSDQQQEKLPLEHGFCNNADITPQRNNINERTCVEKLEIAVSESSSFASSLALSLPRSSLLSAGDGYQPELSASVSPASEAEEAFPLPDTEDQHPTNELTSFTRSRFRKVSGVHYQGVGGEDSFICKSIASQKMAPARIYSSRKHPSTSSDSPVVDKLDGAPVIETCILTSPTNNGHRDLFGSNEDIYRLSQEADITFLDVGHKDLRLSGLPGSMNATSRHDASVGTSSPPLLKEVKVIHKRKAGVHTPFPNVLKMGTLEKRSRAVALWREYLAVLSPMFLQLYQPGQEFEGRPVEVHAIALCQGMTRSSSFGLFPTGVGGHCSFEVTFSGGARLHLRAPSEEQADDWLERLGEALAGQRSVPELGEAHAVEQWPQQPTSIDWPPEAFSEALVHGVLQRMTASGVWRTFYFCLTPTVLEYYTLAGVGGSPLCSYAITDLRAVLPDINQHPLGCFNVELTHDTLYLRAARQHEAEHWMDTMRTLLHERSPPEPEFPLGLVNGESGGVDRAGGETTCHHVVSCHGQYRTCKIVSAASVTTTFLSLLLLLPQEKGLDAQGYKCASCRHDIGLRFGKAKVCEFSGRYYCEHCHTDDLFIIPSRVLHNWDTVPRKVSRQAKEFLEYIVEEPLLDLAAINPSLYSHVDDLATVRTCRFQLKSLRAYLFTCRSTIADELRRRVLPKEYLLEHMHLYSINDLQQVIAGKFASFLSKVVKFAMDHVYSCGLCSQRGFICEVCSSADIIYPFQVSTTKRCDRCHAVFHKRCKQATVPCPRCMRHEMRRAPHSSHNSRSSAHTSGLPDFLYPASP